MEKCLFAILLCAFLAMDVAAQNQQKPCASEQAKQFDFWLGTWDLEWTDAKGVKQTGTNVINKILGGCVIEENFYGGGSPEYLGKSHSLFDAKSGMWKQTWVDSGGEYLDFVGEFKDGKMMLWRAFTSKAGKKLKQRMIFSNIQKDELEWNWESSMDDGKTWKTNWKINYKRRK
jgi:hypothetical protein